MLYCYFFILQIGISCESDRAAIMMAVENYLAEVKMHDSRSPVTASAPFEEASTSDQDYSSIQNVNMVECVICLDLQVSMRFMILCMRAFMHTHVHICKKSYTYTLYFILSNLDIKYKISCKLFIFWQVYLNTFMYRMR